MFQVGQRVKKIKNHAVGEVVATLDEFCWIRWDDARGRRRFPTTWMADELEPAPPSNVVTVYANADNKVVKLVLIGDDIVEAKVI